MSIVVPKLYTSGSFPNQFATYPVPPGLVSSNYSAATYAGRWLADKGDAGSTTQLFVIPWIATTDLSGIAYPPGLVGVVGGTSTYDPSSGMSYMDYTKDQWVNHQVTPVPAVLPAGYTPRLVRGDANYLQRTIYRSATGTLTLRAPGATPFANPWYPTIVIDNDGAPNGGAITAHLTAVGSFYDHYWGKMGQSVGYRYCNIGWFYTSGLGPGDSGFTPWTGTLNLSVSHNADGSDPGDADGDHVDGTLTFSYGDFTPTLQTSPFRYWSWKSGLKPLGAVNPTLGISSVFNLNANYPSTVDMQGPFADYYAGQSGDGSIPGALVQSARAIIPYPFTVTGDNGLIAPGGLVT